MRLIKVIVSSAIVGGWLKFGTYDSAAIAAFALILNAIYEVKE